MEVESTMLTSEISYLVPLEPDINNYNTLSLSLSLLLLVLLLLSPSPKLEIGRAHV